MIRKVEAAGEKAKPKRKGQNHTHQRRELRNWGVRNKEWNGQRNGGKRGG